MSHNQLAKIWANFNGQKGTDKQIEKIVKQLTINQLVYMLKQRNLIN
jgi:hypothetical protein